MRRKPESYDQMTYDELLARIDWEITYWTIRDFEIPLIAYMSERDIDVIKTTLAGWKALRAVVELHKPDFQRECDYCYQRDTSRYDYPCPTIQAIEKELG